MRIEITIYKKRTKYNNFSPKFNNKNMTKQQVQQRVLQNGKPLDLDKFEWDENNRVFSSSEDSLVLDFSGIDNCTFNTGSNCTFNTGSNCTFNTWSNCTFNTWFNCTFNTGYNCTFNTWSNCTFNTWSNCTFNTGSSCTFNTWSNCTFNTWSNCTFKTGAYCVVVRRDIYEVIELKENIEIKLNDYEIKGYTEVNTKKSELLKKADELIKKAEELKVEANKII
jgi:hypothetical protein